MVRSKEQSITQLKHVNEKIGCRWVWRTVATAFHHGRHGVLSRLVNRYS